MVAEPVRLVIWDLDETYWKGTITEGGITEYIEENHNLIIELSRRGIMNSICSKNNFADVEKILVERGILDYFIFPSIDWTPKPERIKSIIDAVQLRPATVMFIDDNPSNRASVSSFIPEIQVQSEEYIPHIRNDKLFSGKDDSGLSRLSQYKLLEKRKRDVVASGGDNLAFLRSSGIRVHIESNIEPHMHRVVELINRTNQLNFTKNRLPEDTEIASRQLLDEISNRHVVCGLVKVEDNYGDYGYCGFFMTENTLIGRIKLKHFCFSCRILGFGVEQWLYRKLKHPAIDISGEVLGDLRGGEKVDWINAAGENSATGSESSLSKSDSPILLHGQCDTEYVFKYFSFDFNNVIQENTVKIGDLNFRRDSAFNLCGVIDAQSNPEIENEYRRLGFELSSLKSNFLEKNDGSHFVFFFPGDFRGLTYRHKKLGFHIFLHLTDFGKDLCACSDEEIFAQLKKIKIPESEWPNLMNRIRIIQTDYESCSPHHGDTYKAEVSALRRILDFSVGQVYLVEPSVYGAKGADGNPTKNISGIRLRKAFEEVVADGRYENVHLIDIDKIIESDDDRADAVHLSRIAYYRLFKYIKSEIDSSIENIGLVSGAA